MALTPEQRKTATCLLNGDHTVSAPLLGVKDYLAELNKAAEVMSAVLLLDAGGSENNALMQDLHAARQRMLKACAGMTRILSSGT